MNKVAEVVESSLLVPVYLTYIEFRDKIGPVIVKHCRYKDKSFSDWLGNGVVVPRTTIMIHMRRKISTLQTFLPRDERTVN